MICSLPRPARHHNIIRAMAEEGLQIPIVGEQGFLTSDGEFVGRRKALKIAKKCQQIISKNGNEQELYSEDVW